MLRVPRLSCACTGVVVRCVRCVLCVLLAVCCSLCAATVYQLIFEVMANALAPRQLDGLGCRAASEATLTQHSHSTHHATRDTPSHRARALTHAPSTGVHRADTVARALSG